MEITKICSKCNSEKFIHEFYKQTRTKTGYQSHCKECDNKRKTEYCRKKSIECGKTQKTYTLVARELRAQGLKKCPGCKEIKKLEESFYTAGKSGYASHCIICSNLIGSNRPRLKQECAERYKRTKERLRDSRLRYKFGITLEQYNAMLNRQNGVCAICGETDKDKSLAVDHCHTTNKVRELLCSNCNPAIGFLRDNPNFARRVAEYLERHGSELSEN